MATTLEINGSRYLKGISRIIAIAALTIACWAGTAAAQFAAGDGTTDNPWIIETPEQLALVRNYLGNAHADKHFKLGNNIALNDTDGWEEWATNPPANTWTSIGRTWDDSFLGTFDGAGFVVRGMYIDDGADQEPKGLFGRIGANAVIKNLGVVESFAKGRNNVGGLVGWNRGTIINSYSTGNVEMPVGGNSGGGLVGGNDGTISNSYSTGSVQGYEFVGGLVGYNVGIVANSYSTGSVQGNKFVGGLVGDNSWPGAITDSYSTGSVQGYEFVGGLVGDYWASIITNSFYDLETSGQDDDDGRGTPKTTAEMQSAATFVDWDFTDVWGINSSTNGGYPFLRAFFTAMTAPTVTATNLVYTGQEQSAGIAANDAYEITGDKETDAGSHTAIVSLKDGYIWTDGTADELQLQWSIAKAKITAPTVVATGLVYTGSEQSAEIAANAAYEITGDISATNAGNYTATVALNDKANYEWEDGNTEDLELPWSIARKPIAVPVLTADDLVYTGSEQTAKIPAGEGYVLSDNAETDAGSYTAIATLDFNHEWDEAQNKTEIREIPWLIAKAQVAEPELLPASLVYTGQAQTVELNEESLLYTLSGNTQTNAGSYNATVALADKANYEWEDGTEDLTLPWSIAKADGTTAPDYTAPATLTAKSDETLANVELPTGWAWDDPTTPVGEIGEKKHKATFTPASANYSTIASADWTIKVDDATSINSGVGSKGSPEARQLASSVQTYYTLKGTPLGTTKPTAPGVYLEKHGKYTRKIAVR